MTDKLYDWRRFWYPRGAPITLAGGGFLLDPESVYGVHCNPHVVPFSQIAGKPCLVLLGEPGIGKTTALERHRAETEAAIQQAGGTLFWRNLNAYQSDVLLVRSVFEDPVFNGWRSGNGILHLFLDSLDECLIRIDTLAALLAQELGRAPIERLRLRIACRTAVWPSLLENSLLRLWGENAVGVYELAPLRSSDATSAAAACGVDAAAFLAEVDRREAAALANRPVTLGFLLRAYQRGGGFPASQLELYRQGCERLCEETSESRRAGRLVGHLTPRQRMHIAARIAALSLFCGRPVIWTGTAADAPEGSLPFHDVLGGSECIDGVALDLTEAAVREVLDTGLFSARGPECLGFAHQTYAEFLAAGYLHSHGMDVAQILSLIMHPGDEAGRVVPQLHEVAAWLAGLLPAVYDRIVQSDPQVLLSSDVTTMSAAARDRLVGSLLQLFDLGKLIDNDWDLRAKYRKLAHPRLGEQAEPFIRDRAKNSVVRRVAIDIVEACQVQPLQGALADVVLDSTDNQHVREQAAAALVQIGDGATLRRLLPCVTGQAGDDPQDELKGYALQALWPAQLTADEVFDALTPRKCPNFGGAYDWFLHGPFHQHLSGSALPVALRWVAALPAWHELDDRFGGVATQVLRAAWEHLESPGVLEPFGEAVTRRLAERLAVPGLGPRDGQCEVSDAQRHRLCQAIVPRWLGTGMDAAALVHTETPLLCPRDLPWIIERATAASLPPEQAFWVRAIAALFRTEHPGHIDALLEATKTCPWLAEAFGPLFGVVELDSPQAEAMRAQYRSWRKLEEQGKRLGQRRPLEPPPNVRVATLLNRAEAGELSAWWQLNRELTLKPTSTHYGDLLESDLTALPGWQAADDPTRQRIVEVALQYLLRSQPSPGEWLGTDSLDLPDAAGYRALRLLAHEQAEAVEALPAERWRAWVPAIIGYPIILGGPGEEPHLDLVRRAYVHAPEEVIRALLILMDAENRKHGWLLVHRKVAWCWDGRLAAALAEKARDPSLAPESLGNLLEPLLRHGSAEARTFAASLLSAPLPVDGLQRGRAVVAATVLLLYAEDAGWQVVWSAIQADAAFGREVIADVAHGRHRPEGAFPQHLPEEQLGELYLWLVRSFPPSEDPKHEGAHFMGPRDSVARFRDSILAQLQHRGTVAAVRAMERLARALPALSWLRWAVVEARNHTLRQTWVPPQPGVLLRMAEDRDLRLVESGEQLLTVVLQSLRRLEQELQGENPAARYLWNKLRDGMYRPMEENELSDYVVLHLRRDLQRRGIVANREVQIRRGEGEAQGERTDIHINAIVPGRRPDEFGGITVIIEVKGCWNNRLKKDMQEQLRDRYLAQSSCGHGLYLVGWFSCAQWDGSDSRKKRTPKMTLQEAQQFFDGQAATLSQEGLCIRALVLNTALR
jgi:predicted NACHT family NTPase